MAMTKLYQIRGDSTLLRKRDCGAENPWKGVSRKDAKEPSSAKKNRKTASSSTRFRTVSLDLCVRRAKLFCFFAILCVVAACGRGWRRFGEAPVPSCANTGASSRWSSSPGHPINPALPLHGKTSAWPADSRRCRHCGPDSRRRVPESCRSTRRGRVSRAPRRFRRPSAASM
jgi:hypothetical protein